MNCILPNTISAGLTFRKLVTLTAYPADHGWGLRVYLRGKSTIDLSSTKSGSQHVISVPATETSNWVAGDYGFVIRAVHEITGDVHEVEAGTLTILPDMATAAAGEDYRSHAQITLDAIEAVIQNRASIDQERYRINNRELYRTPMADLLKLRSLYRMEVQRERAKACGKSPFGQVIRVQLR